MEANDYKIPKLVTFNPTIVYCDPQRVNPQHGWCNRHKKKRKSCTKRSETTMSQLLGTAKKTPTLLVNAPWASSHLDNF